MKIPLSKSFKIALKDKKGFTLLSTMVYITLAVILTISLLSSVSNLWTKFLMTRYQEEFLIEKEQFFTMLAKDTTDMTPNTLQIQNSTSDTSKQKLTFSTSKYSVQIIQSEKKMIYKRTDVATNKTTGIEFNTFTSSSFNHINKVCVGEASPSVCYDVNNALDIVLRSERRVVRNPISYKAGRVIYHE